MKRTFVIHDAGQIAGMLSCASVTRCLGQWQHRLELQTRRIVERIEPFSFDQIYGGWWQANVLSDAKAAVRRSAERYLRAIASAGNYG